MSYLLIKGNVADALRVQLEPVSLDFMTDRWKGEEIKTGHSFFRWYAMITQTST